MRLETEGEKEKRKVRTENGSVESELKTKITKKEGKIKE